MTGIDLDLAGTRARAEAATPGPWASARGCVRSQTERHAERFSQEEEYADPLTVARCGEEFVPRMGLPDAKTAAANAAHIASADPLTVIAMCDLIEHQAGEIARLKAVVDRVPPTSDRGDAS